MAIMLGTPPTKFFTTFNDEVLPLLLEAVAGAYNEAGECYAIAPNADANTYGTDLYRFAGHRLTRMAGQHPELMSVVREHPSFIHRVGDYELICHRVAKEASANIWNSFPNPNTEGVQRGVALFLPGLEPNLNEVTRLVLAHIGNQEDGLCAAYICFPLANASGGIEWGYVQELYRKHGETPSMAFERVPAEEVDVDAPIVQRRDRSKKASEE